MKYIRENKSHVALFVIVQPLIILLIMAGVKVTKDEPEAGKYLLLMASVVCAGLELGILVLLNHALSKIWYDHNTQELCRKGWLWGRKRRIPLSEIKEIVIVSMSRGGTHYIVVKKGCNLQLVPYTNPKIFRLAYTRESQQFVESFWNNFIPTIETMEVENYKN